MKQTNETESYGNKTGCKTAGGMPYSHTFLGGTVQSRTERGYD